MKDIKIIFIDVDGTLADDNNIISEEIKAALKKIEENGVIPVLCSGRTRKIVDSRYKEIGMSKTNVFICSNGAEIFDTETEKVLYSKYISNYIVKLIFYICQKRNIAIKLRTTNYIYINILWDTCDKKYNIIENISKIDNKKIVRIKCKIDDDKVLKLLLLLLRAIRQIKITTKEYENSSIFIGIETKYTNKGNAIRKYLKKIKISKKNACAIGNDLNDIQMFREVKYKVAMENSIDELKKKANFITLSNNDNGVAAFINKKIFCEEQT